MPDGMVWDETDEDERQQRAVEMTGVMMMAGVIDGAKEGLVVLVDQNPPSSRSYDQVLPLSS